MRWYLGGVLVASAITNCSAAHEASMDKPVNISIGMPVRDFNSQDVLRTRGIRLGSDRPSFVSVSADHILRISFGDRHIDFNSGGGEGLATYVVNGPLIRGEPDFSRISSVTFGIKAEESSIAEALNAVDSACRFIRDAGLHDRLNSGYATIRSRFGSPRAIAHSRAELEEIIRHSLSNSEQISVCTLENAELTFEITITPVIPSMRAAGASASNNVVFRTSGFLASDVKDSDERDTSSASQARNPAPQH